MRRSIAAILTCALAGHAHPAPTAQRTAAETVEILRDQSGVPHVYGATTHALFFGAGYALAQDRLAQWELARRGARGRLAEILGPSMIDSDRVARIRDHTDAEWQQTVAGLPAEPREMLLAYLDGLNHYIRAVVRDPAHKLPYEFHQWGILPRPWTVADYAATVAQSLIYYGTGGGGHELENLDFHDYLHRRYPESDANAIFDDVLPLTDEDAVPIIRGSTPIPARPSASVDASKGDSRVFAGYRRLLAAETLRRRILKVSQGASRSVVIGPSRSANGHVLMLQSTADGPDVHLIGAGFDTAGFTLPAAPVPIMGRGTTFGWLITTGEEDLVDTFVETLNPDDPSEYWYRDSWHRMDHRTEVIAVRGATSSRLHIARTVHGPVVSFNPAKSFAYSQQSVLWNHELDDLVALVKIARARNFREFEEGVSLLRGSFNIQYGGEDGIIAHWHAGKTPIRTTSVDPRLPTLGKGELDWQGLSSFPGWPKIVNPPEAYLHVWNNKPTPQSHYGDASRYGATFRTYLGRRLIEAEKTLSVADLKSINRQLGESAGGVDLSLTSPSFFAAYLLAAVKGNPRLSEAVARMERWNGLYEDKDGDGHYDDSGLTLFKQWYGVAQREIVGAVIGDWWHKIDDAKYIKYRTELLYRIIAGNAARTPLGFDWYRGRNKAQVLRDTVARAVSELEHDYGTTDMDAWKQPIYWTFYNSGARLKHPELLPFPNEDESESEGTTAGRLGLQPAYIPNNGSELWNALLEISADTRAFWDASPSGGQSQFIDVQGHGNPHIADQVIPHLKFEFKLVPMKRSEVEEGSEGRAVLRVPDWSPETRLYLH